MCRRKTYFLAILAIIVLSLCACSREGWKTGKELMSQTKDGYLGTVITISTYDEVPTNMFDQCYEIVDRIDKEMDAHNSNSVLGRLNASDGNTPATVSQNVYELICRAKEFSHLSDGAFDISIGAIMMLWKEDVDFSRLPAQEEIDAALPSVGYERIALKENKQIILEDGMRLDLGAIAKGFACDEVVAFLRANSVKHAVLDFGGNVFALGSKPDGAPWRVGLRNPIIGGEGYACVVEVMDKSVVTSGGYQRFFEKDDKTYHHIIDPKTGYPAQNELLSVSVISTSSAEADALSTACFVKGLDEGLAFLESIEGCEGVFITTQKEVLTTSGLDGKVEISNMEFKLSQNEP